MIPYEPLFIRIDELDTPGRVVEQAVAALYIVNANFFGLSLLTKEVRGSDDIASISQIRFLANLRQESQSVRREVDLFFLSSNRKDLPDFIARIRLRADNDNTIEEVKR